MNFDIRLRLGSFIWRGFWAGTLLGLVEGFETIIDGFLSLYDLSIHLQFLGVCTLLLAGTGAILGGLAWTVLRLLPHRYLERISEHAAWSVFVAAQLAWITFLYGFKLLPMSGVGVLPSGGLFNPIIPGTVGLILVPIVVFAVVSVGLYRWCRRPTYQFTAMLVAALLLYWQVSYALYGMSRIAPANVLHAFSLVALVALVALLVPGIDDVRRSRDNGDPPSLGRGAVLVMLVVAPIVHHALGTAGSYSLQLLAHERTALTYRALQWMPPTFSTTPMDELSGGSCADTALEHKGERQHDDAIEGQQGALPAVRGVVFVMIDAFRADLIGARREDADGAEVELTPNLNRLSEHALWFDSVYSTAAVTRFSAASMLTGQYSDVKDIGRTEDPVPTIASPLDDADVRTIAVPVHPILRSAVGRFDVVDETLMELPDHRFAKTAPLSTERVMEQLGRIDSDERFFLFAHFYDPHWYYVPNDSFYFGPVEKDRYHAEVAFTDMWIGRLLERIEASAHGDDVAIVVVGDHGEEFWEHKYIQHVVRLYDESIRVPMLIDHPAADEPRRLSEPVSTVDVAPTLLELFGLAPDNDPAGRALLSHAQTETMPRRPIYAAAPDKHAVIHGPHKLIVNTDTGILELYNLERDPGETHNLADTDTETLQTMACHYRKHADSLAFEANF